MLKCTPKVRQKTFGARQTSGFYAKPEGFCIPDKVNALFDSKMHLYGTVIAWQLFVEFDPAAPAGCLVEC